MGIGGGNRYRRMHPGPVFQKWCGNRYLIVQNYRGVDARCSNEAAFLRRVRMCDRKGVQVRIVGTDQCK